MLDHSYLSTCQDDKLMVLLNNLLGKFFSFFYNIEKSKKSMLKAYMLLACSN